jgi:4-hydroxy-tetrahydrodipicolinate synthase
MMPAGSNNTAETVETTKWAKSTGVDACLVVNPYYNKPNQDGLKAHMLAVAEVGLPILMYNIPGRCGVKMTAE